jgi:hypothetical protein
MNVGEVFGLAWSNKGCYFLWAPGMQAGKTLLYVTSHFVNVSSLGCDSSPTSKPWFSVIILASCTVLISSEVRGRFTLSSVQQCSKEWKRPLLHRSDSQKGETLPMENGKAVVGFLWRESPGSQCKRSWSLRANVGEKMRPTQLSPILPSPNFLEAGKQRSRWEGSALETYFHTIIFKKPLSLASIFHKKVCNKGSGAFCCRSAKSCPSYQWEDSFG